MFGSVDETLTALVFQLLAASWLEINQIEMLLLLKQWRARIGGPVDASPFLKALDSARSLIKEKELIIEALNDWDVLTNTWFEVADSLTVIEKLHEDRNFAGRFKAALLASKVAFCLEDYENALRLALAAEAQFNLTPRPVSKSVGNMDEMYVNKMIEVALDTYKTGKRAGTTVDERLETLINRVFQRNLEKKEFRYVIGLALETRRVDMIKEAITKSGDTSTLLTETVATVLDGHLDAVLRNKVLDLLLSIFATQPQPDFVSFVHCLIRVEKPGDVADLLDRLLKQNDRELLAYQIAFDLYENATQQFIGKILAVLQTQQGSSGGAPAVSDSKRERSASPSRVAPRPISPSAAPRPNSPSRPAARPGSPGARPSSPAGAAQRPASPSAVRSTSPSAPASTIGAVSTSSSGSTKVTPVSRLRAILRGEETIKHHMQFLIKNNKTDMLILKEMRECVRTATAHNATLMANGIMHLGTTCDDFLRDNLEWISKATNWNKFNAVASLGLIHKGHESAGMKLLDPYLPKAESDQFGFKEGGALYALGLMHANHGNAATIKYLRDQLSSAQTASVRHGACLGLGLAAMGTHDQEVYVQLRETLYLDDAIAGEAAGLAMGLVMVGSLHQTAYTEMVQYVCDTQHDKIQRGLRTGISLLAYAREEESETMAQQLLENKSNSVLRATGVCMLAMAYVGTGKAKVATRLLEKVATDPNNDVKRFAVMSVGFLLSNDPEICLSYVGMLVEHFNSHVRYGAAMALGIACAGSGYKEAIALIEPLLQAKENFVRQGAVIALSFIHVQQTDATCSKVGEFRKQLTKMITEKGEDSMAKFGAIIAQGIIDAGGRNLTVSLHNRSGHPDLTGVVGMMCFQQYWYWHSMVHFVSLTTKPTCLIALNKNLAMPKMEFKCNAKASLFAYPPALESKKKEETEKVETAVLSITNKKRLAKKGGKKDEKADKNSNEEEKMEVDGEHKDEKAAVEEKEKKEPEPLFHTMENPCRVVRLQLKTLTMPENSRYRAVKPISQGGIIMVHDKKPEEKEDLVAQVVAGGTTPDPSAPEKEPHATFEVNLSDL